VKIRVKKINGGVKKYKDGINVYKGNVKKGSPAAGEGG
jgi:hypothetical protein